MVLKLQRKLNRKIDDVPYYKWYIPISPELVEEMKWRKGDELTAKKSGKKLVIEKD